MKIAHFSDLHVLSLEGVAWHRYLNKRLTGLINLKYRRKHIHRSEYVRAVAREVARVNVDHVAITGDVTNLALESEFAAAKEILERELHLQPRDISIVPGNHDLYTNGALRKKRFTQFFADYTHCDIDVAVDVGPGHFPYVKLRGPCAIIGLSSAVPRLPFVAAGEIGRAQLDALSKALVHPEVVRRTPVLLCHHPLEQPSSPVKAILEGLRDGKRLLARLRDVPRGLFLHGHLHRRLQHRVPTGDGEIVSAGAASASLHDVTATKMSGFNVYEIDDGGALVGTEAHIFDPTTETFHVETLPEGHWG